MSIQYAIQLSETLAYMYTYLGNYLVLICEGHVDGEAPEGAGLQHLPQLVLGHPLQLDQSTVIIHLLERTAAAAGVRGPSYSCGWMDGWMG